MKDEAGEILYVGKAKNLKKRVYSYWANYIRQGTKVKVLLEKVITVETIVVKTEVEALVLENELIKKHRPQFNVLMRDDKNYLYIRVTMQEEYPRILLARRIASDGAKYFGPYTESRAVYAIIKLVKKIFPICSSTQQLSSEKLGKGKPRACLNYHLGICPGVCLGKVTSDDYKATMREVIRFIDGQYDEVTRLMRKEMHEASEGKKYETAARVRDNIAAVERMQTQQAVLTPDLKSHADVVGMARQLNKTVMMILALRSGRLISSQSFVMDSQYESTDEEVLSAFLRDYYSRAAEVPPSVFLPIIIADQEVVSRWLSEKANRQVGIQAPQRGTRKALVDIAVKNATLKLQDLAWRSGLEKRGNEEGIAQLKELLKLEKLNRIEAYDISNTQGTDSVGSMVVFEDGKMNKGQYRRFKIKTVTGPNDYESLAEVLLRRFAHMEDSEFARKPDLILIDGGKGQVNTVAHALGDIGIQIIGVAKGDHSAPKAKDDIVRPHVSAAIVLPTTSPAKYLLQTIRDEAHRFALGLHTHLARKKLTESQLEKIKGVGPETRRKLIKKFGSMAGVRAATLEEVAQIVGKAKAEVVKGQL